MGWSLGFDDRWKRDIGYGVPATCDYPKCGAPIDRGLSYVCGGEPYGGEHGCGLYFCGMHLAEAGKRREYAQLCGKCLKGLPPRRPTPDTPEWVTHKLTDESWAEWRVENAQEVEQMRSSIAGRSTAPADAPL